MPLKNLSLAAPEFSLAPDLRPNRAGFWRWLGLLFLLCALLAPTRARAVGTWTPLARTAPGSVSVMLLLSDGTVMAADSGTSSNWYQLTPDRTGGYVNGTWSTLTPMHD